MVDISKSPNRNRFQLEMYLERCKKDDIEPDDEYVNYYNNFIVQHEHRFDNPELRKHDLEYDLLTTEWILNKVRESAEYAKKLYATMCNNRFQKIINPSAPWSCSWRYAGGIIADMLQKGDYIDWYCSGNEGRADDEVVHDLRKLGWSVLHDEKTY